LSLLNQLTKEDSDNPDVIIGEFHSLFADNFDLLKLFMKGQIDRYKLTGNNGTELTEKQRIVELRWNLDPVKLLISKGYRHVKSLNEGKILTLPLLGVDSSHVFVKESLLKGFDAEASVFKMDEGGGGSRAVSYQSSFV
jgi:hypothetical protein